MVFTERGLLRPTLRPSLTTMDTPPTATTAMERDLPMLSLKLRLIPTIWLMDIQLTDMVFTERGLLRPTLRPSLTTMDTPPTATTAMERDLPMLSLKLRLIPTTWLMDIRLMATTGAKLWAGWHCDFRKSIISAQNFGANSLWLKKCKLVDKELQFTHCKKTNFKFVSNLYGMVVFSMYES